MINVDLCDSNKPIIGLINVDCDSNKPIIGLINHT